MERRRVLVEVDEHEAAENLEPQPQQPKLRLVEALLLAPPRLAQRGRRLELPVALVAPAMVGAHEPHTRHRAVLLAQDLGAAVAAHVLEGAQLEVVAAHDGDRAAEGRLEGEVAACRSGQLVDAADEAPGAGEDRAHLALEPRAGRVAGARQRLGLLQRQPHLGVVGGVEDAALGGRRAASCEKVLEIGELRHARSDRSNVCGRERGEGRGKALGLQGDWCWLCWRRAARAS